MSDKASMTTITFEVPTDVLRSAKWLSTAAEYDKFATVAFTAADQVGLLARSAAIRAKEALPPHRKPVTKDTKWGQKISNEVDEALYVATDPENQGDFFYVGDGTIGSAIYDFSGWFEVHDGDEAEPELVVVEMGSGGASTSVSEPEPKKVPIKVGQTHLMPVEIARVSRNWIYVDIPYLGEYLFYFDRVQQWELASE